MPPPPAEIGLDPFYAKYLDSNGLPIVSSSAVPDDALYRAKNIIDEMLANRPDIHAALVRSKSRVAIMGSSQVISDMPEYRNIYEKWPGVDWDKRVHGGGIGGTLDTPITVFAETNLLCHENDVFPNEDVSVHEFAHSTLDLGIEQMPDGADFQARLSGAYLDATDAGLWQDMYAGENADEYWAEGVQSWFNLNDPPGPVHNEIDTRAELKDYDPALARLIQEVFGDTEVLSSCHPSSTSRPATYRVQGAVVGPDGEPLDNIGIWGLRLPGDERRYSMTASDGAFTLHLPDGAYTLDIYTKAASRECTFVGWYGPGGFTTTRSHATRIEISGTDVTGIEIRLPAPPDELPFIDWCS